MALVTLLSFFKGEKAEEYDGFISPLLQLIIYRHRFCHVLLSFQCLTESPSSRGRKRWERGRGGGGAERGGERQSQAGGQGDKIQRNKPRGRGEREGERRGA